MSAYPPRRRPPAPGGRSGNEPRSLARTLLAVVVIVLSVVVFLMSACFGAFGVIFLGEESFDSIGLFVAAVVLFVVGIALVRGSIRLIKK